jgi:hypothetical protein
MHCVLKSNRWAGWSKTLKRVRNSLKNRAKVDLWTAVVRGITNKI